MKRPYLALICSLALIAIYPTASGDAIDSLTKALKRLATEPRKGTLEGAEEGRQALGFEPGEFWPSYGEEPYQKPPKEKPFKPTKPYKPIEPKPHKLSQKEQVFYAMSVDERIDDLTKRWDIIDSLSPKAQAQLRKQTIETMLLTVSNVLHNGIATIRKAIKATFPTFVLAKAPIEQFADSVFLFGYLMAKICEKAYRENLTKLYWLSTCLMKNAENRKAFVDAQSGEKKCVKYGCVKGKKCAAVFLKYATIAFEPWVQVSVTGIDADGRHINGLVMTIVMVAIPGKDSDSVKAVNDFQNFAKMLALMLQLFKSMQSGLIAEMKG